MKNQRAKTIGLGLLLMFPNIQTAKADDYAAKERSNAAVGHYARARAMLVEALAEFEQGRKYARPDMLLDPEEWRLNLISRTEELNRILDPRPRVTREGVRFQANSMLIRREKDRLPSVSDGAQTSNTFGEELRKKEMKAARARLDQLQSEIEAKEQAGDEAMAGEEPAEEAPTKSSKEAKGSKAKDRGLDEAINSLSSIPSTDSSVKVDKSKVAKKVEAPAPKPAVVEAEEEEVAAPPGSAEETLFGPSKEKSGSAEAPAEEKAAAALPKAAEKKTTPGGKPVPLTDKQEDQVSKAIDEAIQERVKTIQSNAPKSDDAEAEEEQ